MGVQGLASAGPNQSRFDAASVPFWLLREGVSAIYGVLPEEDEIMDIVLAEAVRRYTTNDRSPPGGEDQLQQFDVRKILEAFALSPLDGNPNAIMDRLLERDLATIEISEAGIEAEEGHFFLAPVGIERGLAILDRLAPAARSDPNDKNMEELLLRYFVNDDRAARGAQPLNAIFKQVGRPAGGWLGAFFDDLRTPEEKRALLVILDRLVRRRLLQKRQPDEIEEPFFEANDLAIHQYFRRKMGSRDGEGETDRNNPVDRDDQASTSTQPADALNDLPVSSENGLSSTDPIHVDSISWTGLKRVRVTHRNARAISRLIDSSLCELATDGNAKTAQARTLLLAAKELTDAPEPPSDIIWELIQRAGAVVGLLDIFFRIFTAVAIASLSGPS